LSVAAAEIRLTGTQIEVGSAQISFTIVLFWEQRGDGQLVQIMDGG
jgi:hypothetical protein